MAKIARLSPKARAATGSPTGVAPSQAFSPFQTVGKGGVAVFAGRVMSREKGPAVTGSQRWITYNEMLANTSIVAAGVRYFLNIVAAAKWNVQPADPEEPDDGDSHLVADFIEDVLHGMDTPWRKVARRASSYRFMGFGIQEWTAKRDPDGMISLADIQPRPQHTIDRWEVDPVGQVKGVWQLPPQSGEYIFIPRPKTLYLVDDTLTDSPEGMGLYRHLVEPYMRLNKYLLLEGQGFERDLRGIPIGRVPYQAIKAAVANGAFTEAEGSKLTEAIESFVKMQTKSEDTSIVLDSAPYTVQTETGRSISGVMQYGLELLQGQSPDFAANAAAVERINMEMARILGAEHLMLGSGAGSANRALAEDKSRNFYQTVNGTLDDIADQTNKDLIARICDLNGIKEELRPKLTHSDISFRAVSEITASLRDMATAGAVLKPDDPAINDVRDMLGIKRPPEPTAADMGLVNPMVDPAQAHKPASEVDVSTLKPQMDPALLNGKGPPAAGAEG